MKFLSGIEVIHQGGYFWELLKGGVPQGEWDASTEAGKREFLKHLSAQEFNKMLFESKCDAGRHLDENSTERLYDGHGIYISKVCMRCKASVLKKYRPDIMEAYEVEEPIDDES